jgi:hypothetical protein
VVEVVVEAVAMERTEVPGIVELASDALASNAFHALLFWHLVQTLWFQLSPLLHSPLQQT